MIATIIKHLCMLALCVTVPAGIVCLPALVDELSIVLSPQHKEKKATAEPENTLPPTLAENTEAIAQN